jgi:hypothetical protein
MVECRMGMKKYISIDHPTLSLFLIGRNWKNTGVIFIYADMIE